MEKQGSQKRGQTEKSLGITCLSRGLVVKATAAFAETLTHPVTLRPHSSPGEAPGQGVRNTDSVRSPGFKSHHHCHLQNDDLGQTTETSVWLSVPIYKLGMIKATPIEVKVNVDNIEPLEK